MWSVTRSGRRWMTNMTGEYSHAHGVYKKWYFFWLDSWLSQPFSESPSFSHGESISISFEWWYLCRPSRSHQQVALTIGTAQAKQVHLWHSFIFDSFWRQIMLTRSPFRYFLTLVGNSFPRVMQCEYHLSIWLERCEHILPTSRATAMGKNNTKILRTASWSLSSYLHSS